MERPNILYLHSHDTGRYIQPYGYAVPTPNLQRLAEGGVVFRNCFCSTPTCSASRAALLTGMYPHNNGMLGLAHRGWSLYDYGKHIVHTLRPAGYHTVLCGVQHVADGAKKIGYDEVLMAGGPVAKVAPPAVEWLRRAPRQPFFLSVGFSDTHRDFAPPGPQEDPRWCRAPDPIPDTPVTRRDMAGFKAEARELDRGFGMVLDALDEAGLADDTLVVCTTDHGIAFPYMKCNLTDHGTGVFLIVRGPGGFGDGRVVDGMVQHLDLFPTLCEVLGIDPPPWLQGRSLLPLLRGEVEQLHDAIYTEVTYHAAYEPMRAVRTPRWKYIRRFGGRGRPVLPNCDDSPSKDLWLEHGWADRPAPEEQLFDLVFDPNEGGDLAPDPAHAHVLADLRQRLERWMQETDDPLLRGPVPAPRGAKVNPAEGLSPREPVVPADEA
ncbi:MAG: sulfatase [Candidatus Brocadiia bacterium]